MSDLKVDGVIASTGTNTNLTLQGKGSGKVAIGDGALLFPDADGSANQVIETNASGVLSFVTPSAGGLTLGTEQATTSGTVITFGSIPAGTTQITITMEDISTNSTGSLLIRIGDSGGIETSGYVSAAAAMDNTGMTHQSATDGFVTASDEAPDTVSGQMILTLKDASAFTWVSSHVQKNLTNRSSMGGGHKSLTAELTQLNITAGGNTFDGGSINIAYQ